MTTLLAPQPLALDESTHEFISTFMSHVAAVAGYGENRIAVIAYIKMLLLAAIATGDVDSSLQWSTLHRAIAELVACADYAPDARHAHAYLQAFLRENHDLSEY